MTCNNNPFNYLIDSFWASLPEQAAEDLANCERKTMTWIKDTVTWLVDEDLASLERHLENARRMRNQYRTADAPASDAPPNPA